MNVELVKLRFDKETLEEDAEERVVSAPLLRFYPFP